MSDFMFPIYLATNKIQKQKGDREIRARTEGTTEDRNKREAGCSPRQNKREAKLKHGNLQISKGLYIIIWCCKYKG